MAASSVHWPRLRENRFISLVYFKLLTLKPCPELNGVSTAGRNSSGAPTASATAIPAIAPTAASCERSAAQTRSTCERMAASGK